MYNVRLMFENNHSGCHAQNGLQEEKSASRETREEATEIVWVRSDSGSN